jgi:hypothetical protein
MSEVDLRTALPFASALLDMAVGATTDSLLEEFLKTGRLENWGLQADDIVFVSGSRFAGLGNQLSDLDLFTITSADGIPRSPLIDMMQGIYIDCETYSRREAGALAALIGPPKPSVPYFFLRRDELDRYYRFAIAHPIYNRDGFETIIGAEFDSSYLADVYARWTRSRAAACFGWASAFAEVGLADESLGWGSAAVAWCSEAVAADAGQAYASPKWNHEKLRAVAPEKAQEFWILKSAGSRTVEDYLGACGQLLRENGIALNDWEASAPAARARSNVMHRRLGADELVVYNSAIAHVVSREAAALLTSVDGNSSLSALAERSGLGQAAAVQALAELESVNAIEVLPEGPPDSYLVSDAPPQQEGLGDE